MRQVPSVSKAAASLKRLGACSLAGALLLASGGPAAAECRGADLFPRLMAEAPRAFEAIQAEARVIPFGRGRFFRISREQGAPSYLFGTLHLADRRVTELPEPVRAALRDARTVALEVAEVGTRRPAAAQPERAEAKAVLVAARERRPHKLLGATEFARLEAAVAHRGLPVSQARRLKAPVLALLLDTPACAAERPGTETYLDALIADLARERSLPVIGLETTAEQLAILDGLPPEAERDLLISATRMAERAQDAVETSILRYTSGQMGELLAWMRSPEPIPGVPESRTPPAFLDRLLDDRSRRMRDRLLPLLENGGAFVAVGAAHLPGENGLAVLLRNEGFEVTQLD